MLKWLHRFFGCGQRDREHEHERGPVETEQFLRARRLARVVGALSYYGDPHNYRIDSIVQLKSPVMRDGGRRARQALALLRNDDETETVILQPNRKVAE
jgi:hypothetical protein